MRPSIPSSLPAFDVFQDCDSADQVIASISQAHCDAVNDTVAKVVPGKKLTPSQVKYILLRLLPATYFKDKDLYRGSASSSAIARLVGVTRQQAMLYRYNPELNKILMHLHFFSVADFVPDFLQKLREGINQGKDSCMHIMGRLMNQILEAQARQPDNHIHLHLSKEEVAKNLETLKSKLASPPSPPPPPLPDAAGQENWDSEQSEVSAE